MIRDRKQRNAPSFNMLRITDSFDLLHGLGKAVPQRSYKKLNPTLSDHLWLVDPSGNRPTPEIISRFFSSINSRTACG